MQRYFGLKPLNMTKNKNLAMTKPILVILRFCKNRSISKTLDCHAWRCHARNDGSAFCCPKALAEAKISLQIMKGIFRA